jgi:hypothetical protein
VFCDHLDEIIASPASICHDRRHHRNHSTVTGLALSPAYRLWGILEMSL